jgi:molybdopterin-dependent oxidoreductase alpha subunit
MRPARRAGGWGAIAYTVRIARKVGWRSLLTSMRAKNACKTCALGMGGQKGGMVNELGRWPEVCKKSFQAMVADMQGAIKPDFFERYSIAHLRTLSPRELEWCGRLTTPVLAAPGDTHYKAIDWETAFDRIATQLKSSGPQHTFFYASGRSSNEAGFVLQLFARLFGTNFVNNCSYYCHQASGVGLSESLGTATATVTLEDVEHADLFFLIGGNPASNHPRLMRTLMTIRRRGGHVIVINPVKEVGLVNFAVPSDWRSLVFGSQIASLYVQPHIGGDIALLMGVAKGLLERNQIDRAFIEQATEGFDEFASHVRDTSWDEIERSSGVDRATIEKAVELYASARNAVFAWTMGITHHEHGVQNVRAIVNLALLRGMIGRPNAGMLPIRGHSNVQGLGSMGVVPSLKQAILDNLEKHLGVTLPRSPGLDTMACMNAADDGQMRTAICLGGNLFGSNPDAAFASRALGNLEQIVYLSTSLNTGHAHGTARETIILPVLARDEEPQSTTQESMFNYVRLSDGGPSRYQGPRAESAILCEIAQRVFGDASPVSFKDLESHRDIRAMIAQVVPGYESIGQIDQTKQEFQIGGRTFHTPRFATASGKARFGAIALPPLRGDADQLRLMTVRSEGQFNTVVYEDTDTYRGQERRDVILINRADMDRLGLRVDQRVTVRSDTGSMSEILVRPFDIRAGNALMYYPEANVLVPRTIDPASKTPAFKSVLISIEPASKSLVQLHVNTEPVAK